MTLLIDPPLLLAGGYALGRTIDDDRAARDVGILLAGAVLVPSVTTYMDAPCMTPVWRRLGGRSGRDLILNSWVLSFDPAKRSPRRSALVGAIFVSYPIWSLIGIRLGRRRRQRH